MLLLKFTTMVVVTGIPAEPPLGVREVIVNVAGVPPLRSSPPPSAVQLADPPSRRAKRRNGGERICTYAKGDPASGEEFRETPPSTGEELPRRMHDSYAGRRYHTLTLVQTSPMVDDHQETWYEAAAIPGRFRTNEFPGVLSVGHLFPLYLRHVPPPLQIR